MAKTHLKLLTPAPQKRAVTPEAAAEQRVSQPRAPYRERGRKAHRGREGQSLSSPRRHYDPCGLPAWAAGFGGLRLAVGAN
jgi:hypothetical protein